MKTRKSIAVALGLLALLVTHAHAQRSVFEPRIDRRDSAERAEDQRLEMLRLQREANEELRRQTRSIEDAARRAAFDELERRNADAWEARKEKAAREFENRRRLEEREKPASVTKNSPQPMPPTAPPPFPLRNPNEPNQYPTFFQFMAAHKGEDQLDIVHKYRDEIRLQLLKNGEYDDELIDEIDEQLFQHAAEQGWLDTTDQQKAMSVYFTPSTCADAQDAALIQRQSLDDGDTAAGEAAISYKSLLSDRVRNSYSDTAKYQEALATAKLHFKSIATTEKIAAARRAAVERGDLPFALIEDAHGKKSLHLGMEIKKCAGDDVSLAKVFEAHPSLDRTLIGAVRKQLLTP